jgi:hypothetical protein
LIPRPVRADVAEGVRLRVAASSETFTVSTISCRIEDLKLEPVLKCSVTDVEGRLLSLAVPGSTSILQALSTRRGEQKCFVQNAVTELTNAMSHSLSAPAVESLPSTRATPSLQYSLRSLFPDGRKLAAPTGVFAGVAIEQSPAIIHPLHGVQSAGGIVVLTVAPANVAVRRSSTLIRKFAFSSRPEPVPAKTSTCLYSILSSSDYAYSYV